jgi:hypothetical protein
MKRLAAAAIIVIPFAFGVFCLLVLNLTYEIAYQSGHQDGYSKGLNKGMENAEKLRQYKVPVRHWNSEE